MPYNHRTMPIITYSDYLRSQLTNAEAALHEAEEELARANALAASIRDDVNHFRRKLKQQDHLVQPSLPIAVAESNGGSPNGGNKTEVIKGILKKGGLMTRQQLLHEVKKSGLEIKAKYVDAVTSRLREQGLLEGAAGIYSYREKEA